MTELEIELEVQARVNFKMNDFKTSLKNRLLYKKSAQFQRSFDNLLEYHKLDKEINSIQFVLDILQHEIDYPQITNLYKEHESQLINNAINNIMELVQTTLRGTTIHISKYELIRRRVVNTIENLFKKSPIVFLTKPEINERLNQSVTKLQF